MDVPRSVRMEEKVSSTSSSKAQHVSCSGHHAAPCSTTEEAARVSGLSNRVSCLDDVLPVLRRRLDHLRLLFPQMLVHDVAHPFDRIPDVRVLWWVEQI